jgi:polyhydroxyalkanoate synthesis repressor PhaR
VRVIQKYPNRRLYDMTESRYVTLDEVRALILEGHDITVQDRRTQADITRTTLLQVLAAGEEAEGAQPVLSRKFLVQAIRAQSSVPRRERASIDYSMSEPQPVMADAASG